MIVEVVNGVVECNYSLNLDLVLITGLLVVVVVVVAAVVDFAHQVNRRVQLRAKRRLPSD